MAKGTLLANATTTKKGGSTAKNGKSSIVSVNQDRLSAPSTKKARTSNSTSKSASVKKEVTPIHSSDDEDAEGSGDEVVLVNDGKSKTANGPRHLDLKSKKYDKHYRLVTRDALEGMPLLYSEEQDKIETILKLFDLEPEYGPAAGMTRLERWKRASNWGLDPPAEVYDILTTIEGQNKEKYRESLYMGRV